MGELRVVVVGGGIAGLVAATEIARGGRGCLLLEAATKLGGRARTRVLDGFHFNMGPHALYADGALHGMLREWGVDVSGGGPDLSTAVALWGGSLHPLPARLSPKASPPLDSQSSAALVAQFKRIAAGEYDERGKALSSVTRALPRAARTVVEALVRVTSYVHAPDLLDAKAALDQVRKSFGGVLYLDGGWRGLIDGLAAAASAAGAELRTAHRVTTVSRSDTGWCIEVPLHALERADAVVLAVPPREANELARDVEGLGTIAANLRPARIAGLSLGLLPGVHPRANFALGMTEPTYFSVHSSTARLAPEGGMLAHIARYLAPDERPRADSETELEGLADVFLPCWRSVEVRRQRQVGMIVAHDIPSWSAQGRRARGQFTNAPGLFVAGDWVGDEGMLADAAAASGRAAARRALSFLAALPPR